jgi:malonyl-CoA O-methyltransferase
MNVPTPFRLDRRALARAFDRASERYDAHAQLQREVRAELLTRLPFFKLAPQRILDLGCGTGEGAAALRRQFRGADTLALDLAPGMLAQARRRSRLWRRFARICADAAALPLASGSVDLVFSSLMLQWCEEPQAVFAEIGRVLRPGGLLLFSTLGPQTLEELRSAWRAVDATPHVSEFVDLPQLSVAMGNAGLAEPVLDTDQLVRHYPDALALMQELKGLGARNAASDRRRGLFGRAALRTLTAAYERVRVPAGIPATFEIIYGAAFGSKPAAQASGGETLIPLSAVRHARRGAP